MDGTGADRSPTRLHNHLKKWIEKAIGDYAMISPGDCVLVGVSGGRDSLALLELLSSPMIFTPPFTVKAVHIDLGFDETGEDGRRIAEYMAAHGHGFIMEQTDIGPLAHSEVNRKNPCFLCSRLRRRRIFEIAATEGCNKIALGHHRDDIIETLLINLFYGREISTMVPKQSLFGGKLHIIRPMAYLPEGLVKRFARERGIPENPDRCPTSGISRRRTVKRLLDDLERDHRGIRHNICRALGNVKPDYLPRPRRESGGWGAACP